MNKAELRGNFEKYKRLTAHRMRNEGAVIEALPLKLDVTRVAAPKRLDSPENGSVEIECPDYATAVGLGDLYRELAPIPLAQITAERTPRQKTVSFLPLARVPRRWYDDGRCTVAEVYPVLVQLAPSDDPLVPRVYLEWYAELRHELVINVRVTIKQHHATWRAPRFVPGAWSWPGAPEADSARVFFNNPNQPPNVTLWWHKGRDYFPLALLGNGKEASHVK